MINRSDLQTLREQHEMERQLKKIYMWCGLFAWLRMSAVMIKIKSTRTYVQFVLLQYDKYWVSRCDNKHGKLLEAFNFTFHLKSICIRDAFTEILFLI